MAEERVVARAAEARGEEEKVVVDWVGEERAVAVSSNSTSPTRAALGPKSS